jgi:hypothetical protein
MVQAEIRGKLSRENENKEDILTSNVFSFFKYTDRQVFLYQFLKKLELDITAAEARQAEFYFWPSYPDGTQPDLVMIAGKYYLLFEAKYHSGFCPESAHRSSQLSREIQAGSLEAQSIEKIFKIIAITAHHYRQPEILVGISEHHRRQVTWINWQSIAYLLYEILEHEGTGLTLEARAYAEDLYHLLVKKNLRNFEGVKVLSEIERLHHQPGALFFDARTAMYRGDFLGFLPALGQTTRVSKAPGILFYHSKKVFASLYSTAGIIGNWREPLFYDQEKPA